MIQIEVAVETRNTFGKGACRVLRSAGLTPAVLYGEKKDNQSIQPCTE